MERQLEYHLEIKATLSDVWDALVNPDKISQYMFGSRAVSDWTPGSALDFYLEKDGKVKKVVKGIVLTFDEPRKLVYTVFPCGWDMEDKLENHLQTEFRVDPTDHGTMLTIIQGDFYTAAKGQKRYGDANKGWEAVLPLLKEVAEQE